MFLETFQLWLMFEEPIWHNKQVRSGHSPSPQLQFTLFWSPWRTYCSFCSPHPVTLQHASTVPWVQISEHKLFLKQEASPGQARDIALLPVPPAPPTTSCPKHTQHELHGLEPGKSMFGDTEKAEATGNTDQRSPLGAKLGLPPTPCEDHLSFWFPVTSVDSLTG